MDRNVRLLNPSEAARQLGISAKALRVYEERGLIAPQRSAAGWRAYDAAAMARAAEIVRLRALGIGLDEVARVLAGDRQAVERVLATHEAALQARARNLYDNVQEIRRMRAALGGSGGGGEPETRGSARPGLRRPAGAISVAFELPWPWGGERFELDDIPQLTHIVGPLGSGKTRLLMRLAEAIPGAELVGMDRLADGGAAAEAGLERDRRLGARVDGTLSALVAGGASPSGAARALVSALEREGAAALVIDMLELGLDAPSQRALIGHLRRRGPDARPLLFTTRSNAILDLDAVGADEAIILCPANHSPPTRVDPSPGAPGYEAVASCLASPEVRARTEGVIAWRPRAEARA